nr:phosphoenolpyruvate--protein phosphotransferase [Staphylococcus aureus]
MSKLIKGIAASDGVAIAKAYLLVEPDLTFDKNEKVTDVEGEVAKFNSAIEAMDNEYMKERAADIRDVSKRVLAHILGVELPNPSMINESVIIVGEDLTPSEVKQGDMIIVDGLNGDVIVNPTEDELIAYQDKRERYFADKKELQKLRDADTVTVDGVHAELAANIGTPNDLPGVIENGAQGIGLYRTEFLYMGRDQMPTEEEQFEAYKEVLEAMNGKRVVVRTLDIGGDKELSYLNLPEEMNPFLGYRAIRLCLAQQDIFRPQLRALLRASVYGKLNIMFPMVATINEFREAKAILLEEKENLKNEGHDISDDIELGIMVEIPATAALADVFAKEVDFFSIGTNDLIQYTLAADRMSERVSYLYQPYNPSILRLVKQVIEASHKEGKWTGMCGEMAGDETAIPLLLGLGLDEFSMSATSILKARRQINGLSKNEMTELANRAVDCATQEKVIELVNNYAK